MNSLFFVAGGIALISTVLVITRRNAIHALLYLVVSLLSIGLVFFTLGAPFAAALEVIIYAGAIMVLFVFVIMMLNVGGSGTGEKQWLRPGVWSGPVLLTFILALELAYMIESGVPEGLQIEMIDPEGVGQTLFGPYVLGVEIGSILLVAGLVGSYHLAVKIGLSRKR